MATSLAAALRWYQALKTPVYDLCGTHCTLTDVQEPGWVCIYLCLNISLASNAVISLQKRAPHFFYAEEKATNSPLMAL